MNLAKFSLNNPRVIYFFLFVLLFGGIIAFGELGKKEDAPFVIKQAVLRVTYSGATPREVEELIVEPIEREVQSMSGVHKINSDSYYGSAKITVELDPATPAQEIPQKWDELRRKVLNIESQLPQDASSVMVSDDFGDVFGIYYGLTACEGYTYSELRHFAELIKREVSSVFGVEKVALYGVQSEVINISIPTSTLSNLAIDPQEIQSIIASQNQMLNSGVKRSGKLSLTISNAGVYTDISDIRNQMITTSRGAEFRLGDIATVEYGYREPASTLMRVDAKRAIGIGIATSPTQDVVATGRKVENRLNETLLQIPIGIELEPLYLENQIADAASIGFLLNLLESLFIVIGVILLVMGLRAGLLIGSSLLFCIGGTMLLMLLFDTGLNRTSLAGFIIAMGMLVDNAIVVSDNAIGFIRVGIEKPRALYLGAKSVQWALFGATLIGIFSFLPLYLAPSATAEIVKPLFVVLSISLLLSWVLALSQTPLFGCLILKKPHRISSLKQRYESPFYKFFRRTLRYLIRWRWATLSFMALLLVASLIVLEKSPKSFFPLMDKPYFRADCILPYGYSIEECDAQMARYCTWIASHSEVKRISYTVGSSPLRYYLASTSIGPLPNVGNILVELYDSSSSAKLEQLSAIWARENLPDMIVRSSLFKLSPAVEATIEFGFLGNSIDTLEQLTLRAVNALKGCELTSDARPSWGNKTPIIHPIYSQINGTRLGISRHTVALYSSLATSGVTLGALRKGDTQIPILLKDATSQDFNLANFSSIPILSPLGFTVPMAQVLDSMTTQYQWSVIRRYNRTRVLKAQCDVALGANAAEAFTQAQRAIEAEFNGTLPTGYSLQIFGEQENQSESNSALAKNVPLAIILIFITLLLLFRRYRPPLLILVMLPLILIGVVAGLALSGKTLDFFAILGLLGLLGMNIKNTIVLLEQIQAKRTENPASPLNAVIEATVSRVIPVAMASGTTILGMIPLLSDSLFAGMAATIMGGLFISTLLTILFLPVAYSIAYRIKL
ncbi:MAG: efflux RND transporter permease subunit [Rikenellaceae bacterium]